MHMQRCDAAPLAILRQEVTKLEFNLTAYDANLERALVNAGKTSQLRRKLLRCLALPALSILEYRRPQKPTLNIGVIGGSMVQGNMNCGGGGVYGCARRHQVRNDLAYPRSLENMLRQALPGCKVQLRERAMGASGISTVLHSWSAMFNGQEDLVIEDFSVNDVRGKVMVRGKCNDTKAVHKHLGSHEFMTRRIRERNASLLLMEAWPAYPTRCSPYTEYVHRTVADFYALPLISFMRAICNESSRESWSNAPAAEHWPAGCGDLDTPGGSCEPHPGPHTHDIYAHLIALFILRNAVEACAEVSAGAAVDAANEMPPLGVSTIMPQNDLTALHHLLSCAPPAKTVIEGCSFQQRYLYPKRKMVGFQCYEDRPGKPGWISEAGVRSSLSFLVKATKTGSIILGFLRSYEGFGRAMVDIDGNHSISLDGHWDERTSQVEYIAFKNEDVFNRSSLSRSFHHPSTHHVRLHTTGEARFKLVKLVTC